MKETTKQAFKQVASEAMPEFKDELERVCVEDAIKLFKSEGFKIEEQDGQKFTTNGWDYDWWVCGVKASTRLTIGGSGYYGGIHIFPSDPN